MHSIRYVLFFAGLLILINLQSLAQQKVTVVKSYIQNRSPLRPNPYLELPLGAIHAEGWLKEMLLRQKNGATGQLDKLYPLVMSQRNGWLGGDGDQWERGPYWIDGLLPLAYILNDKELISKTKPWVEWAIQSQREDGNFGPAKDYPYEPGIQRDNSLDWWPRMVVLKILKQYYSATSDRRVLDLLTRYFRYQLKQLPSQPLDRWTFWARYRAGDNLMVVYWLYNLTGESFLLELADLMHKQTFHYTTAFLEGNLLSQQSSIHCVNLAQGMKEPLIYYQQHPEQKYAESVTKGFADLRKYNGLAHGLYGGDETLHGNNPTQGSELCSAVEMMFSLESILPVTGQVSYADQLEKVAFNALPTQATDDYMNRQYFQQANQVMVTRHIRNFAEDGNHQGTDVCYGLLTGFACCTSNMHQGWPKFTQNLWYATADKGLAALVYAPSEVKAYVGEGTQVTIQEQTQYPFRENIQFKLTLDKKTKAVSFPFHLRIPQWCKRATISINGKPLREADGNQIVVISREWKSGDVLELTLPMHIFRNRWHENSISVERGPLTYALRIEEQWNKVTNKKDPDVYGDTYYEVRPKSEWNYALLAMDDKELEQAFRVELKEQMPVYPWNLDNAPVLIRTKGKKIPSWGIYNDMTGPIPFSVIYGLETGPEEEITLIPYGCSVLRISQFPVTAK
ncbi:glycoside hydrolase family 127 protein [Cytophagaceae bacterium DM2B3-1]|uniref:Glycoside hydrolase family 127 protein n=1 Tax=Xanthocytophaga flava TaxID=3048013 RepID=A0ABT7CE61_9BACT|nr:beta-L-arabinofuranosidase domain-containing protein [Xanthocytophaga flavus]MDJ1492014.1 glycoside hydrolase family 127 protein [Xanthocytophaga flavus]